MQRALELQCRGMQAVPAPASERLPNENLLPTCHSAVIIRSQDAPVVSTSFGMTQSGAHPRLRGARGGRRSPAPHLHFERGAGLTEIF